MYLPTFCVVIVVFFFMITIERKAVIRTHSSKIVNYCPLSSVTRLFLDSCVLNSCLHLDFCFMFRLLLFIPLLLLSVQFLVVIHWKVFEVGYAQSYLFSVVIFYARKFYKDALVFKTWYSYSQMWIV